MHFSSGSNLLAKSKKILAAKSGAGVTALTLALIKAEVRRERIAQWL